MTWNKCLKKKSSSTLMKSITLGSLMGKGTFICLVIPVSVGVQSQQFVRVERLLVSGSFTLTSSARCCRTTSYQFIPSFASFAKQRCCSLACLHDSAQDSIFCLFLIGSIAAEKVDLGRIVLVLKSILVIWRQKLPPSKSEVDFIARILPLPT